VEGGGTRARNIGTRYGSQLLAKNMWPAVRDVASFAGIRSLYRQLLLSSTPRGRATGACLAYMIGTVNYMMFANRGSRTSKGGFLRSIVLICEVGLLCKRFREPC
jgi:hypothetical protein